MSSPFFSPSTSVGAKEIPISLLSIIPLENALSVTVGMVVAESGERVPVGRDIKYY